MGRDGYAGVAILALSVGLFAATLGLERNPMVPVGPAFYPRLMLGLTAVLAAALIVADVLARRRGGAAVPATPARAANYRLVVVQFGIFTAYVIALPYIGFRVATFLFLVAMQASLDRPRSARRWGEVAVLAVVVTAAVYGIFDLYLHVLLPRGLWIEL
jgi:putative tricarboxylic transport membrane protein